MKCPNCGLQRGGTLFTMKPHRAAAAFVSAIALGAVAGFAVELMGWYVLFVAVAFGTFAGEMILRASGRKRGSRLEIATGAGMTLGAIGGRLIVALTTQMPLGEALRQAIPGVIPLAALVIAISSAVGRIRYI